jgi:hypothetical protein
VVRELCEFTDGRSGERVARAIIDTALGSKSDGSGR